jgi:hypothetical protein
MVGPFLKRCLYGDLARQAAQALLRRSAGTSTFREDGVWRRLKDGSGDQPLLPRAGR